MADTSCIIGHFNRQPINSTPKPATTCSSLAIQAVSFTVEWTANAIVERGIRLLDFLASAGQPDALTREIRELEKRFGVPLFDRLSRGMQPTEAGRLLADLAGQIFFLADAAETAVSQFAGLIDAGISN